MAHGLMVANANNVWSNNGHLVNLIGRVGRSQWSDEVVLTFDERLMHLRLFLEADGAALIFLAARLVSEGQLPAKDGDWNDLALDMFVTTYSDYLAITSPTADRVSLRSSIDRLRARGYQGKSGAHKVFLHLQTLYRLGFVERADVSNGRQYRVSDEGKARLKRLLAEIPNVVELERVVKENRYIEVAARVYDLATERGTLYPRDALRELLPSYSKVVRTGVALCPLAPVIEATQILLLSKTSREIGYARYVGLLREAQALHIRDIRFHQDRRGNPAFIKISDDLIRELAGETGDAKPVASVSKSDTL